MFATMSEDIHDSCSKGKPRLPRSQGKHAMSVSTADAFALRPPEVTIAEKIIKTSFSSSGETESDSSESDSSDSLVEALADLHKDVPRDELLTSVELCTVRDYHRIAKTLQMAFEQDPFTNYILGTEMDDSKSSLKARKHKTKLMTSFFEFAIYECFSLGGIVIAVKDRALEAEIAMKGYKASRVPFLGVSCWYHMEYDHDQLTYKYPQSHSFLANMHPTSLKFNFLASLSRCRLKVFSPLLNDVRDSVVSKLNLNGSRDNMWYLADFGTIPAMRGKGLAKKLVSHFCDTFVDASPNSWCYLESTNPVNRKFYEKLGFAVAKTFDVNEDDDEDEADHKPIYMDSMFRYPKIIKSHSNDNHQTAIQRMLLSA